MKKKILKITAFVITIILICIIGFFVNAFVGNPISKMIVTNSAKEYMKDNYSDTDFYIENIRYSYRFKEYIAIIKSKSSIDTDFTISYTKTGKLIKDDYEDYILSGVKTSLRLNEEYRKLSDNVFENSKYPFVSNVSYGEIQFKRNDNNDYDVPSYAIPTKDLELDKVYDTKELGKKAGKLVIYVEDEDVSVRRASEVMLEIKELMDTSGVPFYAMDFVLEYPGTSDGLNTEIESIDTRGFLYEDIYEEGLEQRIEKSIKETKEYYESMVK